MARAYSDDLRKKLLDAHSAGEGTLRELSDRFGVSVGWAFKVSAAKRQTGSAERIPQRRAPSRIDGERVRRLVENKPDIILRELQAELARAGQSISLAYMARVVKQLGLRLKKKSIHATERGTQANRIRREAFIQRLGEIAPEDLIYREILSIVEHGASQCHGGIRAG
ncbi:IS630 transposase-related protein [Silvibacterium sp.]|uniref:IS630 transposase-related protein n=1 Tax=Silvibacterium sp. TaxID=1964179 RepID=UPI0039E50967